MMMLARGHLQVVNTHEVHIHIHIFNSCHDLNKYNNNDGSSRLQGSGNPTDHIPRNVRGAALPAPTYLQVRGAEARHPAVLHRQQLLDRGRCVRVHHVGLRTQQCNERRERGQRQLLGQQRPGRYSSTVKQYMLGQYIKSFGSTNVRGREGELLGQQRPAVRWYGSTWQCSSTVQAVQKGRTVLHGTVQTVQPHA